MTGKLRCEQAERERDQLRGEVAQLLIERAALRAEVERLKRENGSLARMYALAEEHLRERTGQFNHAEAENERLRDVAVAAAQYLADVNADFRTWGSAVKLEQALADLHVPVPKV